MKFRGPSASLNPARESARQHARQMRRIPRGTGAAGGNGAVYLNSPADVPSTFATSTDQGTDGWQLHVADGQLVATHVPTGTSTVLATPDEEDDDGR